MKPSLTLIIATFLILNCSADQEKLDCSGQGDRLVDVIAGPSITDPSSEQWAFLSNEYGGKGEAIQVSRYPFFLNWLEGCQDEYTVNIIHQGIATEFTRLNSYWKFPTNEAINLLPGFRRPRGSNEAFAERNFTIQNVPSHMSLKLMPDLPGQTSFDATTNTLYIDIPNLSSWSRGNLFYLTLWDETAAQFRGLRMDLSDGPDSYDFTVAQPMKWHEMSTDEEEVNLVFLREVLDAEEGTVVRLGSDFVDDNRVRFLVPEQADSYLIEIVSSNSGISGDWSQEYFTTLPSHLSFPTLPIGDHDFSTTGLSVEVFEPLYLSATVSTQNDPFYRARAVHGLLPAGEHSLRSPDFPAAFREAHQYATLPTLSAETGYDLDVWYFPGAKTVDDYWKFEELSWLDRQIYYHYEETVR